MKITDRRHSLDEYSEFDPFTDSDRDVDIRCRKVSVVKTRKPQMCVSLSSGSHEIPAGTPARREQAIVDGSFGCFYLCLDCCDREMEPGFLEDFWEAQR